MCNFVTKLVPQLSPVEECFVVPKEVCTKSRTNQRKVQKPVFKKVNNRKCKNSVENHATRKGKLIDSQVKHMPPVFQEDQEKVNLTDKQESKRILDAPFSLNYQDIMLNIKKNDIEKKKRLENEKKDQLFSLILGDVMSLLIQETAQFLNLVKIAWNVLLI